MLILSPNKMDFSPLTAAFAVWQNIYYRTFKNCVDIHWCFFNDARSAWVSSSTHTCQLCGPLTSTGYTKRRVTRGFKLLNIFNQNFLYVASAKKQILEPIWNLIFLDDNNILQPSKISSRYFICVRFPAKLWFEFQQHWAPLTGVCWFIAIVWTGPVTQWWASWHVTCHVTRSLTTPGSLWTGWMSVWGSGTHSATITR